MSAPACSAYMVVLNQQREQTIQYHEQCERATISPCKTLSGTCTVVENGQVVVKPIQVKPVPVNLSQPPADA